MQHECACCTVHCFQLCYGCAGVSGVLMCLQNEGGLGRSARILILHEFVWYVCIYRGLGTSSTHVDWRNVDIFDLYRLCLSVYA